MADRPFSLVKWYLDCVTADGDVAIVYSGVLRWRGLSLAYNNVLLAHGGRIASRASLARSRVDAEAERIVVHAPKLGLEGTWTRRGRSFGCPVYTTPHGAVEWNCVQPGSTVQLNVDGHLLAGQGYAECLTLTVPPWHLPMRELRWGRFVSAEHTLAWIDWQGDYCRRFAVLDGEQVTLQTANEEEVAANGATLHMSESMPLRAGKLGNTILPAVPRLRRVLPRALAAIDEHKWRSRGVLVCGGTRTHGWVIHEVVHWAY